MISLEFAEKSFGTAEARTEIVAPLHERMGFVDRNAPNDALLNAGPHPVLELCLTKSFRRQVDEPNAVPATRVRQLLMDLRLPSPTIRLPHRRHQGPDGTANGLVQGEGLVGH